MIPRHTHRKEKFMSKRTCFQPYGVILLMSSERKYFLKDHPGGTMETKKFKLGLVPKLIIAIIVGILIGQFLPEPLLLLLFTVLSFYNK
jgi:hypothetical protein